MVSKRRMDVERCAATLVAIPWQGHTIDAVLYHPTVRTEGAGEDAPVVLRLHGLLGNLLDETEHFLPQRLADAGYASLTVNTLLANLGVFFGFGIFADCMAQIAAACDFLKRRGCKKMVIAGHGLGGCMAIHYAAACHDARRDPALAGVVAAATPYSMPDTVRRRWRRFGSQPGYDEVRERAERLFRSMPEAEPARDEIVVVQRAHGETLLPEHTEIYTLRTWWSLAGPEADGAKTHRHIGRIRAPILLVQGKQDLIVEPREAEDLGAVARSTGNPDVAQVFLDADHTFTGQHDELCRSVVGWLRDVVGKRSRNLAQRPESSIAAREEQTLLRFRTRDRFLVHAYLVLPRDVAADDARGVPILLQIHGSLGHFLARGTPRLLPHALRERGFGSLSINTRLATVGQMTSRGIFDDSVHDIEAAMEFLTGEGFRNVFVLGYSLGAAMVVHWAATHRHPNVRGLVLEGVGYSIPDRHRRNTVNWGATPTYDAVYQRAKSVLGDDPRNSSSDQTFVQYQSRGPTREPNHSEIFTHKTWWHLQGPEAHAAMAHRHIRAIDLPMLMIRGEHDEIVEGWEPVELARLAREAGNRHVDVRQISRSGHDCMENADEMLGEVVRFLSTHACTQPSKP